MSTQLFYGVAATEWQKSVLCTHRNKFYFLSHKSLNDSDTKSTHVSAVQIIHANMTVHGTEGNKGNRGRQKCTELAERVYKGNFRIYLHQHTEIHHHRYKKWKSRQVFLSFLSTVCVRVCTHSVTSVRFFLHTYTLSFGPSSLLMGSYPRRVYASFLHLLHAIPFHVPENHWHFNSIG